MMNATRILRVAVFATLLAAFPMIGLAQTGTLTGRVTDQTNAVIPGAKVTVTNEATAAARDVSTNASGYYTVTLLPPGQYRILVAADGFNAVNRTGITLEVDQRAEVNFALEIGAISEQIEVTADAVQLNTVDASRGQVIENNRIVNMPLNGRNYNQLALLSAGAVQPVGGRFGGFSVGGQRTTQNNFILDGVDNNGSELAGAQRRSEMVQPSIDAIQEFKVQTNSYAAEYGRAMGGVVNVTTKSGTNRLHGTLFEFLRNENLDAKNFFDPVDKPKPPFKRNQYGFSVGGPLWLGEKLDFRNKIFWFGDYEGTKIRESSTINSTIPTLRMRTGDFGELSKTITDPSTGNPFPNNVIPANRQDPVAQTLINLYPDPQNSSLAANYLNQSPAKNDVDKYDARIDFNPTNKDMFMWRLSRHNSVNPAVLALPPPAYGGGLDTIIQGYNTGASWNKVLKPNLLWSIRGAWNFGLFKRDNPAQTGGALLNEQYGIMGGNNSIPGSFSAMGITGYRQVGIGGFNPVDRDSQNRQLVTDLSWTKGKHSIKGGFNLIRSQNNIFNIRHEIGTYNYNGRFTGDGMSDFLLGDVNTYTYQTRIQVQLRQTLWAGYVQDDWKITPNLTLNLGMRYEFLQPWKDKYDRMGIFDITTDPANPKLIYAGTEGNGSYGRAMYHSDKNNVMPRFGLAYKVGSKTVVRGGYGIYYTYMEPFGDAQYLIGNPPNAYGVQLTSSPTTPALLLRNGPQAGSLQLENATGLTFSSYNRNPSLSSAQQWNFNIQHELAKDWLFETGYSGSRGTHLLRRYDGNFSPPGPGNINDKRRYASATIPGIDRPVSPLGQVIYYNQDGNSNYHSWVTKIEKRFSQGFTVLGSYTWSKNIGDTCGNAAAGNTSGCGFQDLRNLSIEKALDNQNVPHRFVVSGLYELPFGRGQKFGSNMPKALDFVFGGWGVGSIVTYASGRPYSVTIGGNPANTGTHGVVNRPNVNGNPILSSDERTIEEDFDTSVFSRQADYTIGNLGRNTMQQRSAFNWDFSALKMFDITERVRLQFRFESFHFTNTPRFGQAGGTFGTANFGRITSAGTPRNMQFGMKVIF
ncbi:MAG: hypothetical protein GC160_07775 [Acidobacteria bacterium]|nr:hypothetical protein [Acidobacteriota bacterium]